MTFSGIHRHALFVTIVLAVAGCASGVAVAQAESSPQRASPETRAAAKACRAEIRQYCEGVRPGGGRLLACLQNDSAQLSQACRDALAKVPKPADSGQ